MKICFLADAGSIHTKKWCEVFLKLGHQVSLISFNSNCTNSNIDFHFIDCGKINKSGGNWKVLLKYKKVKKIINEINPDILHAHYATSYGVVGALSKFHPYVITAHGTDVLISPNKSIIYRILLNFAFKKANWINLVSNHMVKAVSKIGPFTEKIDVIPFGINLEIFNNKNRKQINDKFVITSTRSFEPVYNLSHLIKSVGLLKKERSNIQLNLIGEGSERKMLEELVLHYEIGDITTFYGKVDQEKIVEVLKKTHIYCSVSLSDGNSISLVEALACGCIPVVSDIIANHQWVTNGKNGFLVEVNNVDDLKNKLLNIIDEYPFIASDFEQINQKNILRKADLNKNISFIEDKYRYLIESVKND